MPEIKGLRASHRRLGTVHIETRRTSAAMGAGHTAGTSRVHPGLPHWRGHQADHGRVDRRRAEIPAANGHGNARGVATVQALVSNRGEAAGRRLLSEHAVSAIFSEQANGFDIVLLTPVRWGIGYGLARESMPIGARACQWGGHGGSVVFNDQDTGLTVAYVMNKMKPEGDVRGSAIISAAKSSLEPLWRRAARQGRRASRAARRRQRA